MSKSSLLEIGYRFGGPDLKIRVRDAWIVKVLGSGYCTGLGHDKHIVSVFVVARRGADVSTAYIYIYIYMSYIYIYNL